MSRFGNGSNSNGQFWYGNTTNFPGFLYKKNVGVGGRRSTKFAAGGNSTTNTDQYLYNKYKPGQGGVGASSIANRRAKNRLATICNKSSGENNCYPCYMTLGQYNRFLYNPNGFYPCPADINLYSIPTPEPTPGPTTPSAPLFVTANAGNSQAIVSFTVPSSDGGSAILSYTVTSNPGGFTTSGTSSPITITGLTNGTPYTFTVIATNSVGNSIPSAASSPVTPTEPATVPSAPSSLSANPGNTSVDISFTQTTDGGSPITNYKYSTDNGITFLALSPTDTTSPITITTLSTDGTTPLTNGTSYTIKIIAVNAVGDSLPSSSIEVIPGIINFKGTGTTTWTAPVGVTSVDYLVVGGGGGSGATHDGGGAGGGGGGMVLTGTLSVTPGNVYTVIVGDGGAGGIGLPSPSTRETDGSQGENSQFSTIIALGGGGGYRSRSNGSGTGGASASDPSTASIGGFGGSFANGGGGGGGDSGAGSNGVSGGSRIGGAGGLGTTSSISGVSATYGVGGSGGTAQTNDNAEAGATNTGNGATGPGTPFSSQRSGAKGGSGIVIIKY